MSSESNIEESIDVSEVFESLNRLKISVIPESYVDQVISNQYNYYKFPESYELIIMPEIDFSSVINYSCELLNTYLLQQPSKSILWDQFIIDDLYYIYPKPLSCLLNCYIQNAINDADDTMTRKNGLSATRLFFLASTFKGSKSIGFYHICVLAKCSELIRNCISMLNHSGGISADDAQLNEDEKNDLMADLLGIVRDIAIMVKRFQFSDEMNSLDYIIQVLVDITRLEKNSGNILEQVPTENLSYGKLAFIAYSSLTNMFNDNCGSVSVVGHKIMTCMISGLLVDEQREMQLTTRQFNVIRDHHLSFIRRQSVKLKASFQDVLETLLQHLLHRGPDRSELKPRHFQIILEVWRLCPNTVRIKMKYYLCCMVYDADAKLRAVGLETLFKVLSEPEETEPEDPQLLHLMPATKHEFIVALILSKFQDSLLTVRAKAFSLFAHLTSGPPTATAHQTALVKRVLIDPYLNVERLNQTPFCKKDFHDFHKYIENDFNFDPSYITNLKIYPGAKILLWVLNVHARDERAHIRRLSLTLLCNLFLINKKFMEKYYLSLLVNSCADCAMTIRKVAVSGLTDLILKYPDNQDVLKYWFKGLIHLVGDRDKKIQELAVECLDRVILKNIKPYSTKIINDNDPLDYLPWRVLDTAINDKVFKYMMCLCERWQVHGFLTDRIVKDIMTYVSTSDHQWTIPSFYLLQLISHQLTISNMSPIIKYFDTHYRFWLSNEIDQTKLSSSITLGQIVLDIILLNHKRLDNQTKQRFLYLFEELLFDFKIPTRLISKSLDLYTVLQSDDSNKRDNNMKKLFQTICDYMDTSVNIMVNQEMLIRRVFTLGDVGLVQHLKIKKRFQRVLLMYLSEKDQPVSPAVKTIVVLTIGKLSIIDEEFAKEAIVQFGTILKNPCHPSIKINALNALADLCLRCTTLVEQAIPEMCVCLKAESLSVKRVALKLLTGLILEDYIKLRDVAFFALLCMLEDRDNQVREETSSFIVNYLLIKNKDIMERKLIEVIFHFNGYTGEQTSGVEDCFTNPELKAFFSMEGDSKKVSRHCVYRFMLTHMLDDNKLKLMVKIFNIFEEVVKHVSKTTNNAEKERAKHVMKDAFWILKAKEMALTSGKPRDNNNDDDPGTLEKVADLAKKQLVMETYKMVMTDYIIPGVLKLKYELQKNKKILPTVMNDLRAYLCVLTSGKSPIKNEIVKLLSADNDLITEILHDNKQTKRKPGSENCVGESDDDDDEDYDNDVGAHFIQDLEYVTWAQIMDMRDQAEASGIDPTTQVLMEEELEQRVSEISVAEDSLQDEAAANFSQLTGELVRPIKREKNNVFDKQHKFRKTSNIDSVNQLTNKDQSDNDTDPDDSNLPGYQLFD